jgi:hypothetical protein
MSNWPNEADCWPLDNDDAEDPLPHVSIGACVCSPECRRVTIHGSAPDIGLTEKAGKQLRDLLCQFYGLPEMK